MSYLTKHGFGESDGDKIALFAAITRAWQDYFHLSYDNASDIAVLSLTSAMCYDIHPLSVATGMLVAEGYQQARVRPGITYSLCGSLFRDNVEEPKLIDLLVGYINPSIIREYVENISSGIERVQYLAPKKLRSVSPMCVSHAPCHTSRAFQYFQYEGSVLLTFDSNCLKMMTTPSEFWLMARIISENIEKGLPEPEAYRLAFGAYAYSNAWMHTIAKLTGFKRLIPFYRAEDHLLLVYYGNIFQRLLNSVEAERQIYIATNP